MFELTVGLEFKKARPYAYNFVLTLKQQKQK